MDFLKKVARNILLREPAVEGQVAQPIHWGFLK
jgi:hypothetical protein